jgi:hypothetical protein
MTPAMYALLVISVRLWSTGVVDNGQQLYNSAVVIDTSNESFNIVNDTSYAFIAGVVETGHAAPAF